MKTIYLLRHAKSDWDAAYGGDHERPLNQRGLQSALNLGLHLRDNLQAPEMALSSTALRTRKTLEIVANKAGWTMEQEFDTTLYLAPIHVVLHKIACLPDSLDSALFVGHQPTTGMVSSWLLGENERDVPTCSFIHLELPITSWKLAKEGSASLIQFITPASLGSV